MKTLSILVLCLVGCATAGSNTPSNSAKFEVGEAKVFRGPEGIRVEVATLKNDKTQALVRLSHSGSQWDGKVLLHKVVGDEKQNFVTTWQNAEYQTLVVRPGWGGDRMWQVYAPGISVQDAQLSYDSALSEAFDPHSLVAGQVFTTGDAAK